MGRLERIFDSSRLAAPLAVFAVALVVRSVTALFITQPGYADSYYYFHVAQNLYYGRGFVEDFIWNYLENPTTVTHPSNVYWMPLSSVTVFLSFLTFGLSFRAAQVPMIVASALLPVIGYWLGKDVFRSARYAWGIAALIIFSGIYYVYWIVPEGFGLYAVFGSLALILTYKALRDAIAYLVPASGIVALAQLTRADGALLLVPIALALVILFARRFRDGSGHYVEVLATGLGSVLAYLLVLSPWLYRNWIDTGTLFPGAGLKAMFLREYNDMFAYGHKVDLAYFLGWGWDEILRSRASAFASNFWVFTEISLVFLTPFVLVGLWRLRSRLEYLPFLIYNILLFATVSLIFTFPGPRGTYTHSGAALLPFIFGAALVGLDATVALVARFRRHWVVPIAQRNFTVIAVGFAVVLSAALAVKAIQGWDDRYNEYREVASWLQGRTTDGETVMVVDPLRYYYVAHRPSIVFTNDGVSSTIELARRFNARYLVLEPGHPKPLNDLFAGREDNPALRLEQTIGDFKIYRVTRPGGAAENRG